MFLSANRPPEHALEPREPALLERSPSQRAPVARLPVFMTARRVLFAALVATTIVATLALMAAALSPGGLDLLDLAILASFAVTLPWMAVGFWNAAIGFVVMRFAADPIATVIPVAGRVCADDPVTASTAILLCIRNEAPERMSRNLEPLMAGLVAAGFGHHFHVYVLSDTGEAAIADEEEARFAALEARWRGRMALTYRRRETNRGWKAGNVRDFCERWGDRHELAVVLDADSFMTAESVLRLVRIMQADPRLGILQGLVVGMPSSNAFARIFQFGMRLGMRSYTIGSAWWQGDCGPYWGHNAILRLKPFIAHCALPVLPKVGPILSHDQIEAALMRRAGFEVRVLPEDPFSFEENPPTLIEFIRRDLRWCQGNMQYWRLVGLPGLASVSRYQLIIAILMFLGSPAWIGVLVLGTLALASAASLAGRIEPHAGMAFLAAVLLMWFAPKIATVADILLRREARRAFGGTVRFLAGVALETTFFILLCPIMWTAHTIFLLGLLLGRKIGWIGQMRDPHAVPTRVAIHTLWPQTLLGCAVIGALTATHAGAVPGALLLTAGPALSIPMAILTASPAFGRMLARAGLCRLPEETGPPPAAEAQAASGPAVRVRRHEAA